MRRTWASLLAAGALVCGCGDAGPPRRVAARPPADPLVVMHADDVQGEATLCMEDPRGIERGAIRQFNRTHRSLGLRARELPIRSAHSVRQDVSEMQMAARSRRCDVLLVGSAELGALRRDVEDLTRYARAPPGEFFAAALPPERSAAVSWRSRRASRSGCCSCAPDCDRRRPGRRCTPTGGTVAPSLDQNIAEVAAQFERGQGGFLPAVSEFAPTALRGRHVRVAQLPHFAGQPPRPLVEGFVLAVPRRARHPHAGVALLDWLTRPDAMPFLIATGMAPPVTASYADPAMRRAVPAAGAIAVALRHAVPYPVLPDTASMLYAMDREVHAAVAGDMKAAAPALAALVLTGCGGARVADATPPVKGTVRYCANETHERAAATAFNRAHARQGLSVRLTVFAKDKALTAAVKDGQCDVVELISTEVAQFAAAGTLRDISAHVRARRDEFLPPMLLSGHYAKRDWALPLWGEVGMLYSRYYPIPKTLQDLYRRGGVVYGDGPDSAIGFLETAYAAGGRVLSPDGRHSALDSAPNRAALTLLRTALAHRRVRAATAASAFHRYVHGHAQYMRNWSSYLDTSAFMGGAVHGQLTPLPPFAGGKPATLMVGEDLAVTRAARNQRAALAFIDDRVSVAATRRAGHSGYLPPLRRGYSDAERLNVLGGSGVRHALLHATTFPVTPHLTQIVSAVTLAVHAALSGRMSVEHALHEGSRMIDAILANQAAGDES